MKRMRTKLFDGEFASAEGRLTVHRPELNKHGDSEAHHPLPARPTGGHGFETNALVSRVLSPMSATNRNLQDAKPHMLSDEDDYSYPPITSAQPNMNYYDHPDSDTEHDLHRQRSDELEMKEYAGAGAGAAPRVW